ncbi:MAG: pyridoxamine 5'-phosphate oxidase family protein, partial [Bacteroidota bacterium]
MMKTIFKSMYLTLLVLWFIPTNANCQEYDTKMHMAAREIIIDAGTCALITLDDEGKPRARTMDPFIPENDFTVWFGTNSNSRKVEQIKKDPTVTLYYFDAKSQGYVVISGTAQLVNDSEKKEKYWKEEWKDYYPNKGDNYLLIKVTPKWLE